MWNLGVVPRCSTEVCVVYEVHQNEPNGAYIWWELYLKIFMVHIFGIYSNHLIAGITHITSFSFFNQHDNYFIAQSRFK